MPPTEGGEAAGIGADGLDGVGGTAEQDGDHGPAVLEGDPGDGWGQGEDDVKVVYGQHIAGLPRHPCPRRGALAGGAVTVAARMPGDMEALTV